ncbi:MAG: baseplate J/gp47 family protein [Bacteroidota bacterium]
MINNLKPHELLSKDGTSQQDRDLEALRSDYVPVEGRSTEELIAEAQRLAEELRFFNESNESVSDWESFLIDDPAEYAAKTPTEKKIQREQWASQLVAYLQDPSRFHDDEKRMARLSRPHSVLFLTFLRLLDYVKVQMNGLTQRHLDFYFRERLGLTPKGAVPDVVNVLLELEEEVEQMEVKKGTILLAGEDEEGNELRYKTDEDTIISQSRIELLKNVFLDKQLLTIRDAHLNNAGTPDHGLKAMMEMALGRPNPGDSLPSFPNRAEDLLALDDQVKQGNTAAIDYVTEQLFLSEEDFKRIIQKNREEKEGLPTSWEEVYDILDQAFKNKTQKERQDELKALHKNEGFDPLLRYVYGSPGPGDSLPLYCGNPATFPAIFDDLRGTNSEISRKASDYILEELRLTELDFIHILQTSGDENATEKDLDEVYKILERADRQVRGISLPAPTVEKLSDIYAAPDAKTNTFSQYGDEDESKRFKTFGSKQPGVALPLQPANIGFAMSSPTLLLAEGKRQITALIDFGAESSQVYILKSLFTQDVSEPFQIHLSNEEQWFIPEQAMFEFGHHLGMAPGITYKGSLSDETMTKEEGADFNELDLGKYLVSEQGVIHEITMIKSQDEVEVKEIGHLNPAVTASITSILKFSPDQVYLNALKVVIHLSEEDPAIVAHRSDGTTQYIHSEHPSLVFSLNHALVDGPGVESYVSSYQHLMQMGLNKVQLSVEVQGIKNMTLQNDQAVIDARKPFEPFGFEPEVSSSFYLAHEEISKKRLHSLDLDLQWMKQPADFKEYYKNYWLIEADDTNLADSSFIIQGNDSFKGRLFFNDSNAELRVADIDLFTHEGKASIKAIPHLVQEQHPAYHYKSDPSANIGDEDVVEWDRYFKLELSPLDFQHSVFNTLFTTQALSSDPEIRKLKINPPYQPKLKSLKLGYTAYTDIIPVKTTTTSHDALYHVHPFGFEQLAAEENPGLLPQYTDQGALYLGISHLGVPQTLSLLFQLAEGSADPNIEKPDLKWSYLRNNEWVTLESLAILSDTTNGLVNTGIVRIHLPAEATTGDTLLPDSLHWLKVSAARNIAGVSDTIEIKAQVISATLSSEVVASSHFESPLPAETISETLEPIPGIATITQPFTSGKGKPAEQNKALYRRLSERLRHKNRALSMWDYERMVLDKFPQVYKVKCLPSGEELGTVDVILIPDVRGSLPFNPFAPKVAADTLLQIQAYLDAHSPIYAKVVVHNPFYLQVLARCVVKFYPGFDVGFYKAKLIDEIKQFLSPWAYDADSEIRIGGTLHASVLINFIAERPYIDYVAHIKLFQSEDGKKFTDVQALNDGKIIVVPSRPDMVMVSASSHVIDVVDENGYDEDSFEGINYMVVELDFEVR